MASPILFKASEDVEKIEVELDRLKNLYELYFQGLIKREPVVERQRLFNIVVRINPKSVVNTGLRFRVRSFVQKYTTLQAYWNRINRQIEEGRFLPHRLRVGRKSHKQARAEFEASLPLHVQKRIRRRRKKEEEEAQAGGSAARPPAPAPPRWRTVERTGRIRSPTPMGHRSEPPGKTPPAPVPRPWRNGPKPRGKPPASRMTG